MTKYNCFANAASNYTTTFRSDLGLETRNMILNDQIHIQK
jgi:hypothetical protein